MNVHKNACRVLWALWSAGLLVTAISRFAFEHGNDFLFWKVTAPYNQFVLMLSMLPVEPILCFTAILLDRSGKSVRTNLAYLGITGLLWLVYIALYVIWTGGV